MQRFISFIRKPNYTESFNRIEWSDFFLLLFVFYVIEIPLGISIKLMINELGVEAKQIPFPYIKKVIIALLLAPFFEEILMRLNLIFNKKNLVAFLITCFGLAVYFFYKGRDLKLILFIILFLMFFIILINFSHCKPFFIRNFNLFFYFSALLFGLLHIFNFNGITESNFFCTPIIVVPQIFMGLLFGYIRVVYGFIYAVLFHSFINLPVLFTFMT